jgi:cellulose synthase/poly-beta-1,6-N-acetylglucosamine synthase-like glycosyltransferase
MISTLIFILLCILLSYLSFFLIYNYFWLFISLFNKNANGDKLNSALNRFAIIIPAHNEELVLGPLIDSAIKINYPHDLYDVIVIADNCSDLTEQIAKEKGAICYVRNDPSNRGKPFALNWIFRQIDLDRYNGFVIIDADSTIEKDFLNIMNLALNQGESVIQGYFGILNPDETWLTRLMVIPGFLKYRFRYRGKKLLGFSCPLMGNGMCFSKQVIKAYGWDAFTLTENWEYYLKLLLRGYVPTYANAYIYSQTASTMRQGKTQRERWFKGKLVCVKNYLPDLILTGIKNRRLILLDASLELLMPSISMQLNYSIILIGFSFTVFLIYNNLYPLFIWSLIINLFLIAYFIFGIAANRSPLETWLAMGKAPFFLFWKLITTFHALITFKNKEWIKTKRK